MLTDVALQPLKVQYAAHISSWLQGKDGIETLRLLGNIVPADFTTDEAAERKRIEEIVTDSNRQARIIMYEDEPVGIVEVDLARSTEINAPHISFFIGDKSSRGSGIGFAALNLIINELKSQGYSYIYGRALTRNMASQKVMQKSGFVADGIVYTDVDGLIWQNYSYELEASRH